MADGELDSGGIRLPPSEPTDGSASLSLGQLDIMCLWMKYSRKHTGLSTKDSYPPN